MMLIRSQDRPRQSRFRGEGRRRHGFAGLLLAGLLAAMASGLQAWRAQAADPPGRSPPTGPESGKGEPLAAKRLPPLVEPAKANGPKPIVLAMGDPRELQALREREQKERQRLEQERQERQRKEQQEREKKERLEQQRKEQRERQRQEQERLERQRKEQRQEQERLERQRKEQREREEKERQRKEQQRKEQQEREKKERENQERQRLAQQERERQEREAREKEVKTKASPPPSLPVKMLPRGLILRDGSLVEAEIIHLDDSRVSIRKPKGSEENVVAGRVGVVLFQPVPESQRPLLESDRRGVLLRRGDFLEGEFKGMVEDQLTMASVLFGLRRFNVKTDVAALVLRGRKPVATPLPSSLRGYDPVEGK